MGNNMADFYAQKQLLNFDKARKVRAALHMDFGHLEISGRRYSTANLQAWNPLAVSLLFQFEYGCIHHVMLFNILVEH